MVERRDLISQKLELLRSSAVTPEVTALKSLLGLLLEDAKHKLVTAAGENLLWLQGEAQALQRLIRQLEEKPRTGREQ